MNEGIDPRFDNLPSSGWVIITKLGDFRDVINLSHTAMYYEDLTTGALDGKEYDIIYQRDVFQKVMNNPMGKKCKIHKNWRVFSLVQFSEATKKAVKEVTGEERIRLF